MKQKHWLYIISLTALLGLKVAWAFVQKNLASGSGDTGEYLFFIFYPIYAIGEWLPHSIVIVVLGASFSFFDNRVFFRHANYSRYFFLAYWGTLPFVVLNFFSLHPNKVWLRLLGASSIMIFFVFQKMEFREHTNINLLMRSLGGTALSMIVMTFLISAYYLIVGLV